MSPATSVAACCSVRHRSPGPVITLQVDDIDATFVAIEKHGGAALGEKLAVGDMGFAAYFNDSEGGRAMVDGHDAV